MWLNWLPETLQRIPWYYDGTFGRDGHTSVDGAVTINVLHRIRISMSNLHFITYDFIILT